MSLMTGYQGDPERNAEAMAGGYYHTGDVRTSCTAAARRHGPGTDGAAEGLTGENQDDEPG